MDLFRKTIGFGWLGWQFTGIVSATLLYFFHQVIPDWKSVADPNTYYLDVMKVVGGPLLFTVFSIIMCVSQFGSGFTGQVSAARLIYGMGRDNVLPRSLFGYLSPRHHNPTRNIILIGVLAFIGTITISMRRHCNRPGIWMRWNLQLPIMNWRRACN